MKTENTYCDEMRQLILLEDSGELTREKAGELGRHLAECSECDAYRNDVGLLMQEGRSALPDAAPSAEAVSSILEQAARPQNVVRFPNLWRYAAAAAAVLVLLAGTYTALYNPADNPADTEGYGVDDLQIMVAFASDGSVEAPEQEGSADNEQQLKSLANTLLRLQGFTIEEEAEPEDITDLFLPTALQSRSTPASPAGTSV